MLSERNLIVVFVVLTIIIPIFAGIMISRAWSSDIDEYMNNILNQTNQTLNNTTPKDLYIGNFTDERGNNFEGNTFDKNLGNNTPVPWPICFLIDTNVNEYKCHSV